MNRQGLWGVSTVVRLSSGEEPHSDWERNSTLDAYHIDRQTESSKETGQNFMDLLAIT